MSLSSERKATDRLGIQEPLICVTRLSPLQVTAGCPGVCECPARPPSCPPGVSSVPDGCGCCKVCAAQLNQDCHEGRPCDHHKGLECNYGNDVGRMHGICRGGSAAREGGVTAGWGRRLEEQSPFNEPRLKPGQPRGFI